MLSVILTILKIIGITILVILGLLLLILLLVLFVPIRYRVNVEHGHAFLLDGRVSWLLHLVHARINKSDQSSRIWVRILGFLVYDSSKPKSKSKFLKKTTKVNLKSDAKSDIKSNIKDVDKDAKNTEVDTIVKDAETIDADTDNNADIDNNTDIGNAIDTDAVDKDTDSKKTSKKAFKKTSKESLKSRILGFFQSIKQKIKEFFKKLFNIKHKISLVIEFIRNEVNKEFIKLTFASFIKLIKHILPKKLKIKLIFGTGDPCSTGQALGIFGILYSLYGDRIEIRPDFENKILQGRHYAKGRIRIWSILIIAIKLLLDKRFKEFKMNYQLLKEAL